jgi:hypothetical protein
VPDTGIVLPDTGNATALTVAGNSIALPDTGMQQHCLILECNSIA